MGRATGRRVPLFVLMGLFISSLMLGSVLALDWVGVTESVEGDQVYVDMDSFDVKGERVTFWARTVHQTPLYDDNGTQVGSSKLRLAADCGNNKLSEPYEGILYGLDEKVLDTWRTKAPEFLEVSSGTIGEAMLGYVCYCAFSEMVQEECRAPAQWEVIKEPQGDLI